ncbi:hypothetical protein GPECTOR_1g603 [Gonium pectorale]|uniref:FAS1 domain-containing protein n=1 Tax=Gonium pectorale TaxID=33097 RepID=A0A150H4Y0_GONPE|nr:hypothetical protein GPECTOR_1g603 [Gonium pectorale]|eukprot:KXZ56670.1 hypothetical protein GPECTOR_1g603 [Gonium pectorale]
MLVVVLAFWREEDCSVGSDGLEGQPAGGGRALARTPAAYICNDPDLTTLCRLIDAAGAGEGAAALQSGSSLQTVFAPTNDAFDKDGKAVARALKLKDFGDIFTSPTAADRLLRGLIVPGQAVLSATLRKTNYKNLLKKDLTYSTAIFTSQVYISSSEQKAEIIQKDIRAGQSVIYKVNRVPY